MKSRDRDCLDKKTIRRHPQLGKRDSPRVANTASPESYPARHPARQQIAASML
ncbi:hypothetical protein HMPREF9134_01401 [Porphyromonas catoniae F0037]|uniref:Uncharacterized protein n=1 Tax=Porphyromonas catoniae F0037 TaxID=1127696 RepID=L1NAW4_9PORP|nr:hypothetical protein HMPREF9134_01401 [Porphyromonas catoniae F0037]